MLKEGDKPYWKQREYAAALAFKPNIVIIKLGTNDTKPQNWKHGSQFAADYKAMIAAFRALDSKPEVYACPSRSCLQDPMGVSLTRSSMKMSYRPLRLSPMKPGVRLIDLNTPMKGKAASRAGQCPQPNAGGAKIMAETIAKRLKTASKDG